MNSQNARYIIECFTCRQNYDAAEAVLCNCLSSERSFVCPMCFNCFCRAPKKYKDKFWESAPQTLWNRMLQDGEESASETEPDESLDTVKRPLVLIVEPDPHIRRMAKRIIQELGYGTAAAEDGEMGIMIAQRYLPDLILTAALMPKLDGREMCLRLKESRNTSNIKVVIITALYTQQKYRCEAFRKFHVDEYLSEPLRVHDLQLVLQKYLPFINGEYSTRLQFERI